MLDVCPDFKAGINQHEHEQSRLSRLAHNLVTIIAGDVDMQGPCFLTTERAPVFGAPVSHHHLSTCKLLGLLGQLQLKLKRSKRAERDNPVGKPTSLLSSIFFNRRGVWC